MKITVFRTPLALASFFAATLCADISRAQGTWSAGTPFPTAVVRAAGVWFPANNRFYTMGGRSADTAGSDFMNPFEYDPGAGTWTMKAAAFPDNQNNNMVAGVLVDGGTPYIFCVGGSAAGATTSSTAVRRYDPVADSITVIATDPWSGAPANTLPGGAAVFNNKLYVLGGFTINVAMTSEIWEFDPAGAPGAKWTLKTAALPAQIGYVPCATVGSRIDIGGGSIWNGTTLIDSTSSFSYDPVGDAIAAIAVIPRATAETKAVNEGGELWVLGGGRVAPNPSTEVDAYSPGPNSWALAPAFTTARRNDAADTDPATGKIYMVGGYDSAGAPSSSLEIFTAGPPPISAYCFGDGTGNACPCGSPAGAAGHGCSNSDHPGGALLSVLSGSESIGSANLVLRSTGHHLSTLAVWFQGDVLTVQPPYGDGLRCAGTPLVRLYTVQPNVDPLDSPSSPSIVAQGGITVPGTIKGYFLAYRDPANYGCPPPATYNATNALRVVWGP